MPLKLCERYFRYKKCHTEDFSCCEDVVSRFVTILRGVLKLIDYSIRTSLEHFQQILRPHLQNRRPVMKMYVLLQIQSRSCFRSLFPSVMFGNVDGVPFHSDLCFVPPENSRTMSSQERMRRNVCSVSVGLCML